jgi:hypothetical protein
VLVGVDAPHQIQAGQNLSLRLYWQTTAKLEENLTVFVQLLNADGVLVAQKDNEPGEGLYPTSIWEAGQVVSDPYLIPLPVELPSGSYELIAGLYTWPSMQRLPVYVGGQPAGDYASLIRLDVRGE